MDGKPDTGVTTQAFVVSTSEVRLVVSYASASVSQLMAWNQVWAKLLGRISAAPTASGRYAQG